LLFANYISFPSYIYSKRKEIEDGAQALSLVLTSKFKGKNRLFCLGENICFIAVMKIVLRALCCLYRIHVYVIVLALLIYLMARSIYEATNARWSGQCIKLVKLK